MGIKSSNKKNLVSGTLKKVWTCKEEDRRKMAEEHTPLDTTRKTEKSQTTHELKNYVDNTMREIDI